MFTIKKHLSLKPLIEGFKQKFVNIQDKRRTNSVDYPVLDTALSVLACMFYKSGSLLKFQRNMERRLYKSNLQQLFSVSWFFYSLLQKRHGYKKNSPYFKQNF